MKYPIRHPKINLILSVVAGIVFFLFMVSFFMVQGPSRYTAEKIVIEEGYSVKQTAQILKDHDLIRSKTLFIILVKITGNDSGIKSGMYYFKNVQNLFDVTRRVVTSDYGISAKRVVLHEGLTRNQMAEVLSLQLEEFDPESFLKKTEDKEGYLFPDTYEFLENVDEDVVIKVLENTFEEKTEEIKEEIKEAGKDFEEIIIMASIIEKEASATSKQEVSNILWHRIEIGMALQVDAPFVYERQKGTFDLSTEDLREDSEYNTYTRKGLTPTPISNPGLEAIIAAANPEPTNYLFFLTGSDGNMYYSTTHDEHVRNKNLYLK